MGQWSVPWPASWRFEQLVFVGGVVAGVLITDPAMPEIRPTLDVDVDVDVDVNVICRVIAWSDDHHCRWCMEDLVLDLMPTQGEILGFSDRW